MSAKLILGSAQFGLDYGISNTGGKINETDVVKILKRAHANGIELIDTASMYGNSEEILGKLMKEHQLGFDVISKLPHQLEKDEVESYVKQSAERLNISTLYGYLIHDFKFYQANPDIFSQLRQLKEQELVQKVGFSVYRPSELEYLIDHDIHFDILQIPYSVFDRRFAPFLSELRKRQVEIHSRSVFLQGLFFLKLEDLPAYFEPIRDKLTEINYHSHKENIPLEAILLNFALSNDCLDGVIIGVESEDNIISNLEALQYSDKVEKLIPSLDKLELNEEKWLLPYNWEI